MRSSSHRDVPPGLRRALEAYKARLLARFGTRLERVALFGSWARGEARRESDVDVLVLVSGLTWQEDIEASRMVADVCLETDIWLSPSIYSLERFQHLLSMQSPFAGSVEREAIPV
ncbi:MAG: nucleotidyltransferase domain-containing protein [Myxococcaceae bacterium]|nr:nucleotidyltransferase domain-containing protein [Myxococcaceae bacterium]MCI0670470.1 nucleotidyltransferase domain-containing protein [Myxococcaceae bacterium]